MCNQFVTVDSKNLENGVKLLAIAIRKLYIRTIACKMRCEGTGYPSIPNPMSEAIPE